MDFQSIRFSAEERVKRDPSLDYSTTIKAVIADCLAINEDPGHRPAGLFMDWNWFRLDCYKMARGEIGRPIYVGDLPRPATQQKLAKAA